MFSKNLYIPPKKWEQSINMSWDDTMREIKAILKQSGEHVIKDMFGAVSLMFILGVALHLPGWS